MKSQIYGKNLSFPPKLCNLEIPFIHLAFIYKFRSKHNESLPSSTSYLL